MECIEKLQERALSGREELYDHRRVHQKDINVSLTLALYI